MDLGVLHELPVVDLLFHRVDGGEVVVDAVLLPLARFPRRVADAEHELPGREVLLEELDEVQKEMELQEKLAAWDQMEAALQ